MLFHLLEKAEMDIYDISVSEITAQYLAYLQGMSELNLEIASEFLVMAAALLKLKSKKLLPGSFPAGDEAEEDILALDSREDLVRRLVEYRYYSRVAEELRGCEQAQKRVFARSLAGGKAVLVNPEQDAGYAAGSAGLSGLVAAFQRLLGERERVPEEIAPDDFTVRDKIKFILTFLRTKKEGVEFSALFSAQAGVGEIIVTFFALLELVRQRKITVRQAGACAELMVMRRF